MTTWLNHVTISAPRNGTATHAVDPSTGTVLGGTLFTPTAGRLLVVVVEGAVTSTTPTGWTLPTGGSAINNTGLYVWYRTAAGSDTFSTTHNGPNYACVFDIFEFAAGSSFVSSVSAINVATDGSAGPTLSGLTGTNMIMGAVGQPFPPTSGVGGATWSNGAVESSYTIPTAATDGVFYGHGYLEDFALTSVTLTASSGGSTPAERLAFAVNVVVTTPGTVNAVAATGTASASPPAVTGTSPGVVTAVRAQGAALGRAPVVSNGTLSVTVTAVRGQATAVAQQPAVDVIVTLTGGGPAAGTAVVRPPTVSANSTGSVAGVIATANATAVAPVVSGSVLAGVTAVRATVTGTAPAPTVTGTSVGAVNAVRATATATSTAPGVILAETLPSNVGTGRITGRFAEAKVLVGDADGIPNLYPFTTETVTFTSTAPILLDTTATPAPVVIIPRPIVCTLDSLGYLVDSAGHQYVDLIATNDPDLTPTTRKWRATFSAGLGIATFDFVVLSGTTKDLTAEIPT